MSISNIALLYKKAEEHIKNVNIGCFKGMSEPLFKISDEYPGIWLEHLYDSVFYAKLYQNENQYMINTINLFINNQKKDGQLPCYVWDTAAINTDSPVGFGQIQECVSYASICLMAYELIKDKAFLLKCYNSATAWVDWLEKNRMPNNKGLIEQFVGFDTGHDNSARNEGFSCIGNYVKNGDLQNAATLPPEDGITPVIAVDMNCNYYGNLLSLSKIADILGFTDEAENYLLKAEKVKQLLIDTCFDKEDCFFYDVDKNGNKRKVKSSTFLHLFMEGVLDKEKDKTLIDDLYTKHIKNPNEFWSEYPFPSVAINDPSTKNHKTANCWGYFTEMLIALRSTLWMDKYGFNKDFDFICEKTVLAWCEHFDKIKFGQELDPITGEPSPTSEWYSSCMLFFVYACRRLNLINNSLS